MSKAKNMLPNWYIEMLNTTLSIVQHNYFFSFKRLKDFIEASLEYIPGKKDEALQYIKVSCTDKGEKDKIIYFTIDIFFKLKKK